MRFGERFDDVRVHTGAEATERAASFGAAAYTFGRDIVFGPARYAPETDSGRLLVAHELAHVVQQRRGRGSAAPAGDVFTGRQSEASARRATDAYGCGLRFVHVVGASSLTVARETPAELAEQEQELKRRHEAALNELPPGMRASLESAGLAGRRSVAALPFSWLGRKPSKEFRDSVEPIAREILAPVGTRKTTWPIGQRPTAVLSSDPSAVPKPTTGAPTLNELLEGPRKQKVSEAPNDALRRANALRFWPDEFRSGFGAELSAELSGPMRKLGGELDPTEGKVKFVAGLGVGLVSGALGSAIDFGMFPAQLQDDLQRNGARYLSDLRLLAENFPQLAEYVAEHPSETGAFLAKFAAGKIRNDLLLENGKKSEIDSVVESARDPLIAGDKRLPFRMPNFTSMALDVVTVGAPAEKGSSIYNKGAAIGSALGSVLMTFVLTLLGPEAVAEKAWSAVESLGLAKQLTGLVEKLTPGLARAISRVRYTAAAATARTMMGAVDALPFLEKGAAGGTLELAGPFAVETAIPKLGTGTFEVHGAGSTSTAGSRATAPPLGNEAPSLRPRRLTTEAATPRPRTAAFEVEASDSKLTNKPLDTESASPPGGSSDVKRPYASSAGEQLEGPGVKAFESAVSTRVDKMPPPGIKKLDFSIGARPAREWTTFEGNEIVHNIEHEGGHWGQQQAVWTKPVYEGEIVDVQKRLKGAVERKLRFMIENYSLEDNRFIADTGTKKTGRDPTGQVISATRERYQNPVSYVVNIYISDGRVTPEMIEWAQRQLDTWAAYQGARFGVILTGLDGTSSGILTLSGAPKWSW